MTAQARAHRLWDSKIVRQAIVDSVLKLDPRRQVRNPVMFTVYVGSILTTGLFVQSLVGTGEASPGFIAGISVWLWFTVLFANFAEAMAEGRGRAQADALRRARQTVPAKQFIHPPKSPLHEPLFQMMFQRGEVTIVPATELRAGDVVFIEAGDYIPSDGEIIDGIASVDESAITGESAPVIRESGGDRSGVTGGTRVLSDWIVVRISADPGETFLDRMIAMVEGAKRQKTPNEIALDILLAGMTIIFLLVCVTLLPFSQFAVEAAGKGPPVTVTVLVALLVCLIPTTIGGLLSAIGIAGMDRMIQANVIAMSGRAVEAAGDVDVLLLDKTGTITLGNRQAVEFVPVDGVEIADLADAAQLASLADETPEGRSIVVLAKTKYGLRGRDVQEMHATFIPFSAQTRTSGVNCDGRQIRKGAADAIEAYVCQRHGHFPVEIRRQVERISKQGGTPLVVAEGKRALGVIHLKDIVKGGMKERFAQMRQMGIQTVMITGDNPLTAATIAAEAGVDDFQAEATPEAKLALIRKHQAAGHLVAMTGDGTNDSPALAQADVAVGYIEPHSRPETQALVLGLDVLPRRQVLYRDAKLLEFDLEAALERCPQLLLVDELAHTNAPGVTHAKRWQDVMRLLDAGIDVYTTLNVQHLESLNDVVAQITGVVVRETVPDAIFEQADEIELVDLAPDDLLERLREGKVYIPREAERAIEHFFTKGNLIALREMALRRTAERVGTQMDLYRSEHAVAPTWPARERLIVCVGPSPYAGRLVRATRRMAASLKAPWIAVHVETPDDARMSEADRDRLASTMQLAEQLGGQTATISGHDVADELIRYARSRNVTRIVVGKPKQSRWSEWFRRPLVYELTRICGDIDVYVISGDPQPGPPAPPRTAPRALPRLDYLWAVLVIGLCTAISAVLSPLFHPTNLVMVYLLGVVIVSLRFGRGPSIFASVLAVATFDFLFVPPRLTFAVADTQYLLTFAVMLMTGLVISTLVARVRFQADSARGRERSTAALYLPLAGSRQAAGVLGVLPAQGRASIDLEQQHLLQTFADLVALAIQRAELAAEAERIRLGMETERLRSSLLSAVSHDLRTPLSAITGAGSTLLDSDTSLDRSVQRELASSILKESERLNRLVANLLDMTRLQAGALEVHKEWQPVEEVIGASLERLARQLKDRPLSTHIAPDLPFVPLDDLLIQQVLVNLLENAVRHTPAGTPIELTATAETDAVAIEVADRGSGLPDPPGRLFEMFYRPASGNARSGTGLGLAICRGIVELHGGKIEAAKRPDGGAVFRFRLPVQGRSPGAIGESLTKEPVEQ